jgi:3-phosphoshikimate 1-carboxyvinyltransferase
MDHLDLGPIARVEGSVRMPGSKSISNRVLLLAGLSRGETLVRDALESDDTAVMVTALRALGVQVTGEASDALRVTGCGGRFPARSADLFLGNAGTAFRPLTAALAFMDGEYRLSGVPRMHERPISDLVDGLVQLGARIDYLGERGYPPLALHPGRLNVTTPVSVKGDVSSQFLSALLMAAPLSGSGFQALRGNDAEHDAPLRCFGEPQ